VQFLIDDAEQPDWGVPDGWYEYIHMRVLLGSFADLRGVIARCRTYVRPGGWVESQEIGFLPWVRGADGAERRVTSADGAFGEWCVDMHEESLALGRPLSVAHKLRRWYEEAGFVDVREEVFELPIGPWHPDPEMRELGSMWRNNILSGLQGFSLGYFTRGMGWSKNELEVYLVGVRKALQENRINCYQKVYVVYGRKPE
jgi:hypothetical protein